MLAADRRTRARRALATDPAIIALTPIRSQWCSQPRPYSYGPYTKTDYACQKNRGAWRVPHRPTESRAKAGREPPLMEWSRAWVRSTYAGLVPRDRSESTARASATRSAGTSNVIHAAT